MSPVVKVIKMPWHDTYVHAKLPMPVPIHRFVLWYTTVTRLHQEEEES